ncbi:hypothetical protein [Gloeobacter morelensis]|uniref:Uncharacterized protein n=1 Tax=Gloeobacter morelensis MG652769 TaxID=2781736 RepID=A0ABY3PQP6_9CYAN|nr:hypothetical protein [Gloeobacter morelensis]UFP95964.1 hypothetical protein ISF26_07025 [Gloeobacter morelensis MG652769]
MDLIGTSLPLVLLGIALAALAGTALGAYAGASIRTLTRAASTPVAAGIGVGSALVATVGTGFLVAALFWLRLGNLPVGWLAAGVAFGLVVALVTVDWAGAALAAAFVGTYAAVAVGGLVAFSYLGPFLRFIPPFVTNLLLSTLFSLVGLALLLIVGFTAALLVRLLNQYVLTEPTQSRTDA